MADKRTVDGKRTVDQIERDLETTRQRLAENLSLLVTEIHPKIVVHRTVEESKKTLRQGIADVKAQARESADRAKRVFKDDSGWKWKSVAIAGIVTAALVTVIVVSKKHSRD